MHATVRNNEIVAILPLKVKFSIPCKLDFEGYERGVACEKRI